MEITKIEGEDGLNYYQVQDPLSLQGVYYVAVDREEKKLAVTSIDPSGDPDLADTLLISTRVGLEAGEEESGAMSWGYRDDAELSAMLSSLLGPHAAMVQADLGLTVAGAPPESGQDAVDAAPPDAIRVGDMSFSFDPDSEMSGGDPEAGIGGELPGPEAEPEAPGELEIP